MRLLELHAAGEPGKKELAELLRSGHSTGYRALECGQLRSLNHHTP
jgi:hypothetical protein